MQSGTHTLKKLTDSEETWSEQVFVHDLNQTVMAAHPFPKEEGKHICKNVDNKKSFLLHK